MSDTTDIYGRVSRGDYEPAVEWKPRPVMPAVLRKAASALTAEEVASLPAVRAEYAAAEQAWMQNRTAHPKSEREAERRFAADLLTYHGLPDNDFTQSLYGIAWREGHANGYSEVANCFADLAELYEVARKHFCGEARP